MIKMFSFQPGCSSNLVNMNGVQYRLINSVIKGYHVYQIKPPVTTPATFLPVDLEYTNINDNDATLVWIPPLDSFSDDVHNLITDAKKHLQLKEVAGLPIGHAPRGLGSAFREIVQSGANIYAQTTGDPVQSFAPWPCVFEKGGGVVIPCTYIVIGDKPGLGDILVTALKAMPEGNCMKLISEDGAVLWGN